MGAVCIENGKASLFSVGLFKRNTEKMDKKCQLLYNVHKSCARDLYRHEILRENLIMRILTSNAKRPCSRMLFLMRSFSDLNIIHLQDIK